ncbi:hypothetical protein K3495_g1809 [Podosphaera aphanis]|nr:hypothetical protein K3495_g1809 [Podosphaera aphanis]
MEAPNITRNTTTINIELTLEQSQFLAFLDLLERPDISFEMIQRQLIQPPSSDEPTSPSLFEIDGERTIPSPSPSPSQSRVIPWLMGTDLNLSPEPRFRLPPISTLISGHSNNVMEDSTNIYSQILDSRTLPPVQNFYSPTNNMYDGNRVQESPQSQSTSIILPDSDSPGVLHHRIYPKEQLHFIRYLKEDLNLPWAYIHSEFNRIFCSHPEFVMRDSEAALASRSYRDNHVYAHTDWKLDLNERGAPIRVPARVRNRSTGEDRDYPFKLVEKHPFWAVKYTWVLPEHKARAQEILDELDSEYFNSPKDRHRRLIEQAEIIEGNLYHRTRYMHG